ncbi:MAG: hypothetical protein KBE09_04765 [Candidatus Pacebacteria bacterium]|nr:hypothetical protein [Candidatus Paceibacterota bacterium]
MERARKAVKFLLRTTAVVTACAVVIMGLRITFSGTPAYASSDLYNPSYCLGAWENPRAASGARETADGTPFNDFGPTNAAFLPQNASSLLFCGYFAIEQRERPPEKVTLSFVWSLDPLFLDAYKEGEPSQGAPASGSSPVDTGVVTEPTVPNESAHGESTVSNEEASAVSESPEPVPVVGEDPVPVPSTVDVPPPPAAEAPAPAPAVEATPPPAPPAEAPVSMHSFLESAVYFFTPIAHAQEAPVPAEVLPEAVATPKVPSELPPGAPETTPTDAVATPPAEPVPSSSVMRDVPFVRVSYSFDGANWVPLQAAGTRNWEQFQVEIPAGTWEELQNLQIMLLPLPGDGNRPPLYLDAVELTVEQDLTFSEIATDTVEDALALLDSAAASITEAFSPSSSDGDALLAAASAPMGVAAPVVHEHTKEVLVYTFAGSPLPVVSNLPWHPEKFAATLPPNADLPAPQVAIDSTGRVLSVRGYCDDEYYVVLTFRNPDDYYGAPQQFTSNYAGVCDGGSFQYEVTHLPENTPDGTYYLLLAKQGSDTPWVPTSKLLPIQIGRAQVVVREDAQ